MKRGQRSARTRAATDRARRKRGRAPDRIVPLEGETRPLFGYMARTIEIVGDIVSRFDVEWEAQR
jgi:hypothetical protein